MATYKQIHKYVKDKYGFFLAPCYIADAKRKLGFKVRIAHNRIDKNKVKKPCPEKYLPVIKEALLNI